MNHRAPRVKGLFVILVFGTFISMVQTATAQNKWPITEFRVHFGARSDFVETPQAFTRFTDQQVNDIQRLLHQAALELESMGFPPPRLVDKTEIEGGGEAYVVYLYDFEGVTARYMYFCEGEEGNPRIDLNAKTYLADGKIADRAYSDTAHELFHAVQRSTALFKNECYPGGWITEGTAEAVGHDVARILRGSNMERKGSNSALMRWGGRDYTMPLRVGKITSPETHDLSYETSSLWRYLAELTDAKMTGGSKPGSVFHDTDYSYLARSLGETIAGTGPKAELDWLNRALLKDPAIGAGLDEVYPDFVAAASGYGERIETDLSKDEARRRWLSVLFNGCHDAGFSRGSADVPMQLEMGAVTSDCIRVRFGDMQGQVPIRVSARAADRSILQQVSVARLGSGNAARASVPENAATAEWTFSMDASGPSFLVVSNVAPGRPQDTRKAVIDFSLSVEQQADNPLRVKYESLLPKVPDAIRKALLKEFDEKPRNEQEQMIRNLGGPKK